ncbi:MAG TPA: hypothetical protein VGG64_09725 [Pirellulales bacterium]
MRLIKLANDFADVNVAVTAVARPTSCCGNPYYGIRQLWHIDEWPCRWIGDSWRIIAAANTRTGWPQMVNESAKEAQNVYAYRP